MDTQIICPSDKSVHCVVPSSLPICFAIIQHLPKLKDGKEITNCFTNRLQTAESEHSAEENETLRREFKHVLRQFNDEYKCSKLWDDAVRQIAKRLGENTHEQVNIINMAFDRAIMELNEKRQIFIADIKHHFEKEKDNVEREKYKRKKYLEDVYESFSELKKADRKLPSLDYEKLF